MRKMSVLTCSLIVAASVSAWAQELPTTEELFRRIDKAAGELTTYSFDMHYVASGTVTTDTKSGKQLGRIVRTDDGERHQFRSEFHGISRIDPETPVDEANITRVCDGESYWFQSTRDGRTAVEKHAVTDEDRREHNGLMNPMRRAKSYTRLYDLSLVAEKTIDGEDVYVLQGKRLPEFDRADRYPHCTIHVGKDDLFPRRIHFHGGGHGTYTTEFKNVKLGIDVDDDLFEYEPPAGAKVEDRTKKDE